MISISKTMAKSVLDNHQLLCKAIQFPAGKGLGFNFDHEIITHIFLLPQEKKISRVVFVNTSLLVC